MKKERKQKKDYVNPTTIVVEMKSERILCGSPQFNSPFGEGLDW